MIQRIRSGFSEFLRISLPGGGTPPLLRRNNLNFTFRVTYGILKEKTKGVYHNVKQRDLFNRRRTAPS